MTDVYASVNRATALTITDDTLTKVTGLSLTEVFPTGSPTPFDNGDQNFVCIAGAGGIYAVNVTLQWGALFAQPCLIQCRVNGSALLNMDQRDGTSAVSGKSVSGAICHGLRHVRLAEGDTVDLRVKQQSGSSQTLTVQEFTFTWVHSYDMAPADDEVTLGELSRNVATLRTDMATRFTELSTSIGNQVSMQLFQVEINGLHSEVSRLENRLTDVEKERDRWRLAIITAFVFPLMVALIVGAFVLRGVH